MADAPAPSPISRVVAEAAGSRQRPRIPVFSAASLLISVSIVFLVIYPVTRVLMRAFFKGGSLDVSAFRTILAAPWLPGMLLNTVLAVVGAGFFAILTSATFAWLNERTDARLGLVGDVLPLVPLLVPTIAMAIGWVFLATSDVGFLNVFLKATLGRIGIGFQFNIASWPGLIFVYTLYFIPYTYLIIAAALRNVDPALEEASRLSGAGVLRTLRRVSLPAIAPAIFGAGLLVVIVGVSLYSVPVIIATRAGIDILSVRLIRMLTYDFPPKTDEAVVLGVFMFMFVFGTWLVQRRVTAGGRFATISGKSARQTSIKLGRWRYPARALMIFYLIATSILPLFALVVVALQPFWQPTIDPSVFTLDNYRQVLIDRPVTRNAMRNSFSIGLVGGATSMTLVAIAILYAKRRGGRIGQTIDGVTKLPAAFANIVVALGFLIAFSVAPFRLSGTLLILVLCYLVVYLPQASVAAGSAVAQVGSDLTEASAVSGAGDGRTFGRIVLPLMTPGMVAGWALVFVLMSGDITASALLAGTRNPVIGFVILDIWEQGTFGSLAALASSFVVVTSSVVLLVMRLTRRRVPV
jgi:iron(III) transport system permease protein